MSARVLVVDDMLPNVRLLEAKLAAEYFEVITATSGEEALEAVQTHRPDIILLDVMMPGMDGIEVCRRIKSNPRTQHVPVIMTTVLDQPEDRLKGLEAGADDFLTKPINDTALFCRLKSLVRLKMLTDELHQRAPDAFASAIRAGLETVSHAPGRVLVVDNRSHLMERIQGAAAGHEVTLAEDPQQALFTVAEGDFELVIINLDLENYDGLRLCSQLRSLERTRQVPILIIIDPDDNARLIRALEMGVNDYLARPIDRQELLARIRTQIRRWRYTELLRSHVVSSLELALSDPLTGFYNRRFLEAQVEPLARRALEQGRPVSLLVLDVDHFKSVNDTHGHDAGDRVLAEIAERIRKAVRGNDYPCRIGGEEFVVALPDAEIELAAKVAERIRKAVHSRAIAAGAGGLMLPITISIGVASCLAGEAGLEAAMKRADTALYRAKQEGRNRVVTAAAA